MKQATFDRCGAYSDLTPKLWVAGTSLQTCLAEKYYIATAIRVHEDFSKYDYVVSEVRFTTQRTAGIHAEWMVKELNYLKGGKITK